MKRSDLPSLTDMTIPQQGGDRSVTIYPGAGCISLHLSSAGSGGQSVSLSEDEARVIRDFFNTWLAAEAK